MRLCLALVLALAASLTSPAFAQPAITVPPRIDPATRALPGNDIGTGSSLPLSDKAGNITSSDTTSLIAGHLPDPSVGDDASVRDLLLAARNALAAGRDGEAQEALERAETRSLDRSVPLFQTGTPSRNPMVERIHLVLQTLGDGDRLGAMQLLEQAMAAAKP